MDALSFIFGFLAGCFFSLVLSTFLAKKVGEAVYLALKSYHEEKKKEEDDDPSNWWKRS